MLPPQNNSRARVIARAPSSSLQRVASALSILAGSLVALVALWLLAVTICSGARAANIVTGTEGEVFDTGRISSLHSARATRPRSALALSSEKAAALLSPRVLYIGVIDVQNGIASFNPAAKERYPAGRDARLALIRVPLAPEKKSEHGN